MVTFVLAKSEDVVDLLNIYNYYITNTTATFDFNEIKIGEFKQRIFIDHSRYKTFLIHQNEEFAGFCFLTQYRNKPAYDETAEIGIYLKKEFTGKGIGKEAVGYLENVAIKNSFSVIVASMSGENISSVNLFKSMGYNQCAIYRKIATKFGRKMDIIDFQKIL